MHACIKFTLKADKLNH